MKKQTVEIDNKNFLLSVIGKPLSKIQKVWLDEGDGKNPDTQTTIDLKPGNRIAILVEYKPLEKPPPILKKKRGRPKKL